MADERITIYEVENFCFYSGDSLDPQAEKAAEREQKKMIDLGKVVNRLANTDHQEVHFYPLTTSDERKGFCDNHQNGARIGYCFDFRDGTAHFAFSGKIDAQIARQVLAEQGYKVKKVDEIQGIVLSYEEDDKETRFARDMKERRDIEARHAEEDVYCR